MRILILGIDGYIGWALANRLLKRGYTVAGVDDGSRRRRVMEIGSDSLIPISSINERTQTLKAAFGDRFIDWINISLGIDGAGYIESVLEVVKPDVIVHLAEQPSAPWSMKNVANASTTQLENVLGTLHLLYAMKAKSPSAHLVKLGSMGEYGTPDCTIPEGRIPENCLCDWAKNDYRTYDCAMKGLLFPRTAGSFYHLSKVHDTHNIEFACRTWGLSATDIMQGIVYGNEEGTRFDYDQYFGTVINRFCLQALIGHPLTVYGLGKQTRGFLPLNDSLQCIELIIENPPSIGEYRTFNQYEDIYELNDLANIVSSAARKFDIDVTIEHIPDPRVELEAHQYKPIHNKLFDLGYIPTYDIEEEIRKLMNTLLPHRHLAKKHAILPTINWR